MNKLAKEESQLKFEKIQNILGKENADAAIITSSVNQYWLCGFIFDGYLYITKEREPILFVRRPSDLIDDRIITIRKPEQIPDLLKEIGLLSPKRVFIEADQLTFNAANRLQTALEMPELLNISNIIRKIRSIKSVSELNQMRECADIHSEVYKLIPSLYRKGMSDLQLQIEIEREMRLHGSIGIFRSYGENMDIFMGSMLAGNNAQSASPYDYALGGKGISPLLPLGANGTILKPGTTLMVDMAGNYKPYMDDMSRTFVIEHAPDIAYKAHSISIEIHNEVKKQAKAGLHCSDIYSIAEDIVNSNGLQKYFMGTVQQAKFIGHGVGLEINEPPVITPRSNETLESGMAFALEPKFVLPNIGAVGIENTYIVHHDGIENITKFEEELIVLN
jgi:Xaa-Pro aminopeptidase